MRRGQASLIGALFGRVGLLTVAIVLAIGLVAFQTARQRIDEAYDGQLIIGANVLRALMHDELAAPATGRPSQELEVDDAPLISAEDRKAFDDYAAWRMFRIWQGPSLVMRSDTGPPLAAPPAHDGFDDVVGDGHKWRIYTLHVPDHRVAIQVGERLGIRAALVQGISVELAAPLLLLIPAACLLIWLSLRDGLSMLRRLTEQLERRTSRDLSPLEQDAWPSDLGPLVGSVNRLLARLQRSFTRERNFVDQAAHQLRTPLAAIKLQVQMIEQETEPAERRQLVEQLRGGVDRAAVLIDRLLTLARLESEAESQAESDLSAEVQAALADLAPVAAARGVDLAFAGAPAQVRGDPALLRLICANLLDNAVRHAPPRSEVEVRITPAEGGAELRVTDHGPGIAPADRRKVLQRFYRGTDAGGPGVGLGLAIVSEAIRLVGGRLELLGRADGAPGLQAKVAFSAAPKA